MNVLSTLSQQFPSLPPALLNQYVTKVGGPTTGNTEKVIADTYEAIVNDPNIKPPAEPKVAPEIAVLKEDLEMALKEVDELKIERAKIQKQALVDFNFVKESLKVNLQNIQALVDKQTSFLAELQVIERATRSTFFKLQELEVTYSASEKNSLEDV
eukprot:TRINITY_DN5429_c0_g1_i1.p1 TRINITY_DN5429_c0_g1~~TRINITY_DN5429_c0_g1_i1.p1  ORF type:complete len:156 (-),score=37.41 TRINITY_DN5429_c0_g1_i1:39-506(-)